MNVKKACDNYKTKFEDGWLGPNVEKCWVGTTWKKDLDFFSKTFGSIEIENLTRSEIWKGLNKFKTHQKLLMLVKLKMVLDRTKKKHCLKNVNVEIVNDHAKNKQLRIKQLEELEANMTCDSEILFPN